jgi:hypothetical protein
MAVLRYTPGDVGGALALVSSGRTLLVRLGDNAAVVDALWLAISTGESLQSTLEVLTAEGFSKAPAFALAELARGAAGDATLNCIVRGDITLVVATTNGPVTVDAARATTWVEQSIGQVQSFAASAGAEAGSPLAISGAAVWASTLSWTADEGPGAVKTSAASTPISAAPAQPEAPAAEKAQTEVVPAEKAVPETAPTVAEQTITAQTVRGTDLDELVAVSAYDSLFTDETVVRSIQDAAVRPVADDPDAPETELPAGDHDGMTVMTGDIAKLRGGRKPKRAEPIEQPPAPRYLLQLSTGANEVLEGTALIGRAPSVSKVSGGTVPKLIAIQGNPDISRNHVQFSVEGDTVVVTDLNSRNGTTIVLPGRSPQLLRQGEATSVLAGTLVDLGGGLTITVGQES